MNLFKALAVVAVPVVAVAGLTALSGGNFYRRKGSLPTEAERQAEYKRKEALRAQGIYR